MLKFFTDPYPEEILYSVVSRYHYYSGNKDFKETFNELFNDINYVPSIQFSSHLGSLASNLDDKLYDADFFINNNTLLPVYEAFINEDRILDIKNIMASKNGKSIYSKIGYISKRTISKKQLYYCPLCSIEDMEIYREAYFHRIHQLDGVYVCPTHNVILKQYEKSYSKIELNRMKNVAISVKEINNNKNNNLFQLAKGLDVILKNQVKLTIKSVKNLYTDVLCDKGYKYYNGNINQAKLNNDFLSHYDKSFLELLNLSLNTKYNWVERISRYPNEVSDPVKHIVFINFLIGDINNFMNFNRTNKPFGNGSWPCLNPVCKNYNKFIIENCDIKKDYKSKLLIGTFKCECGFTYSRSGPDTNYYDNFKIGSIKEFGDIWEDFLRTSIIYRNANIRVLSNTMKCDYKTIVKYATKLGLRDSLNTKIEIDLPKSTMNSNSLRNDLIQEYINQIVDYLNINKNISRTNLRNIFNKQYSYLYRHDKELLFSVLPLKQRVNTNNKIINWEERDIEYRELILKKYNEILNRVPLVRVTKSLIGKELNLSVRFEKNYDKLSKSITLLNNLSEKSENYRLRRIDYYINMYMKEGIVPKAWEIQRHAGLRTQYFRELKDYINNRIEKEINIYESK